MLSSAHVPEDKRSPLLALGILSISFLMSVSNAVSGTIPLMEKYFSLNFQVKCDDDNEFLIVV